MPILLSEAEQPLFVARLSGVVSDSDYLSYLARAERAFFASENPYALLFDATEIQDLGPNCRSLQSTWINQHRAELERHCVGVGFALRSALHRGMLAAAHLIAPPSYPFRIFSDVDSARAYCQEQLQTPPLRAHKQGGPTLPNVSTSQRRARPPVISVQNDTNSLYPARGKSEERVKPGSYSLQASNTEPMSRYGLPQKKS